jgi:hypothetical protein
MTNHLQETGQVVEIIFETIFLQRPVAGNCCVLTVFCKGTKTAGLLNIII